MELQIPTAGGSEMPSGRMMDVDALAHWFAQEQNELMPIEVDAYGCLSDAQPWEPEEEVLSMVEV